MAYLNDRDHLLDDAQLSTGKMVRINGEVGAEDTKEPLPLPRKELFLIWIVHASQGFQTTMLFPMLVFMVGEYGLPAHATGKYAGILASLYPFAQFCTSFLWGNISDRTGRKKWLIFGNTVAAFSSISLGLCKTFSAACVVRFTAGLLNGSATLTKSILGELCDGPNQAKGFAVLNLAWGIGSIIGPVFAGLLAQPCLQYKSAGCPPFLSEYPFLLPCFCAFLLSLSSAIASFKLKETIRNYSSVTPDYSCSDTLRFTGKIGGDLLIPTVPCETQESCFFSSDTLHFPDKFEQDSLLPPVPCEAENSKSIGQTHDNAVNAKGQGHLTLMFKGRGEGNKVAVEALEVEYLKEEKLAEDPKFGIRARSVLQDHDVVLASLCYSMTGLTFIITDELFPLFGAASKDIGGLGLDSSTLGLILSEGGIVLFVYTLLLYPKVAEHFGPLWSFRIGLLSSIPVCIIFPATSLLSGLPVLQMAGLLTAMAGKCMAGCNAFTSVLILVANSATHENMGAVTGLSHGFCSLFRAVGPALGGLIWSFSVQKTYQFHQFMAWLAVTILIFSTFSLSFLLPHALDRPKISPPKSGEIAFHS